MSSSKRLDYILVHLGLGSRKQVKSIIRNSELLINGVRVRDSSVHVKESDKITLDGEPVEFKKFYYFMMNKPKGIISATTDSKQKTVIDLLQDKDKKKKLFPVGRLDKDTEGLMFLTTDGKLAYELLSPNKLKVKIYIATVLKELTNRDITFFSKGIILEDGYKTAPSRLEILDNPFNCKISITEGKFHQIKRMFVSIGNEVLALKRISIDTLFLDDSLKPGEYREITEEELNKLKA